MAGPGAAGYRSHWIKDLASHTQPAAVDNRSIKYEFMVTKRDVLICKAEYDSFDLVFQLLQSSLPRTPTKTTSALLLAELHIVE